MIRGWPAIATIIVLSCVGSWALLQVDWSPPRPTVACTDVFASAPALVASEDPNFPFLVNVDLHEDRPPTVAQHQIIDANGFGWVLHEMPDDGRLERSLQLPRVEATHTVRTALLSPEEAMRAEVVRRAARSFDLRAWLSVRGWLEPAAVVCAVFEVPQ